MRDEGLKDVGDGARPMWSVMIPCFERTMVAETIRSVLAQDRGEENMQIEVVDNGSVRVDVGKIVREVGKGRVGFFRQEKNVGMVGNWNACVKRARGEWVHILHDDDVVYPGFYEAMEAGIRAAPEIAAAFCPVRTLDSAGYEVGLQRAERGAAGIFAGLMERFLIGNAAQCAGMVVRRVVYEVGGFDETLEYVADWDMWMRVAARGAVWYEPRVLAGYRRHEGSETSRLMRSGRERREYGMAVQRWLKYAGETAGNREAALAQRAVFALEGLEMAGRSFARGDFWAGRQQAAASLEVSSSPAVLRRIGETMGRWDQYVNWVGRAGQEYRALRTEQSRAALLTARRSLAQQWMELEEHEIESVYQAELGRLEWEIVQSGIGMERLAAEDEAIAAEAVGGIERGERLAARLLAAMLYAGVERLTKLLEGRKLPGWLAKDLVEKFRVHSSVR